MNTKSIQADQFEKDKANCKARVLQLDFAMGYECKNQNEVQSALWSRGSVALFTAAAMFHGQTKVYLICFESRNKEKETILLFVEHLHEQHLLKDESMQGIEEIIWTSGSSSEFLKTSILYILCEDCQKSTQRASPGNTLPILIAKVLLMALVETARPLFASNTFPLCVTHVARIY